MPVSMTASSPLRKKAEPGKGGLAGLCALNACFDIGNCPGIHSLLESAIHCQDGSLLLGCECTPHCVRKLHLLTEVPGDGFAVNVAIANLDVGSAVDLHIGAVSSFFISVPPK